MTNPRAAQLAKTFHSIIHGERDLTPRNGPLFLEAICAQREPVDCVSKVITSKAGLNSLQASMCFDLSTKFLNTQATSLLKYIQVPELKAIGGGEFLNRVLLKIVDPPFFWDKFTQAFRDKKLEEEAQVSFAWLLLQLILLPGERSRPYRSLAQEPGIIKTIEALTQPDAKSISYKIKNVLAARSSPAQVDDDYCPGGRHDNDFADFHDISIIPTADEMSSTEPPFMRPSTLLDDPKTEDTRLATYFDNQFRLLREDMIYEMREELSIARGSKKNRRRGLVIHGLRLQDVHCGIPGKRCKWGITLKCQFDLPLFQDVKPKDRKAHITNNPKILRHQSMSCLLADDEIIAFPTINRDEDLLSGDRPIIVVQLDGEASTKKALLKLPTAKQIKLVQIDVAFFSYDPILKALQNAKSMPLSSELLFWKDGNTTGEPVYNPTEVVQAITKDPSQDLQKLLKTPKSIILDKSQAASLLSGLTQNVSLIQGPPGTGKSFIGALLAKVLHDFTTQTILVVCYTNHALDQFLGDLFNVGIPKDHVVRLGSKFLPSFAPVALQNLQRQDTGFKRARANWVIIDDIRSVSEHLCSRLQSDFSEYKRSSSQNDDLLTHLEFEAPEYFEAFDVPQEVDGMVAVGKKGRAVTETYLLDRWVKGEDAGIFKDRNHDEEIAKIWDMPLSDRKNQVAKWKTDILKGRVESIHANAKAYNERLDQLNHELNANVAAILKSKRIIGCTTTAAAKYSHDIQRAAPDVLLVEEAGEILESHVLTALGAETKQLILIGDHKQLRPKVNNYLLTVEKGEGYDLNRSLFERLVLKGYPHQTLTQQHRMRPEISTLIRQLTYPDLVDAPNTKNRPNTRGVQNNIVFVDHDHPEDDAPELADRRDDTTTSKSSKQNTHEVMMILKILRYLAQQGYGTEKIVILTPYLGQLQKLQVALKKDNDPILNDLDSHELVRAGLLDPATAKMSKRPIRLATIDNYQGEESDIVLVSLTRSNSNYDIGFMSSPERLNVLLSRARNSLIMLGNAETFLKSRKGHELWGRLFELLNAKRHVYSGFPVKCERHPDRMALLSEPADFDKHCPDGGCNEPCGVKLNCGLHICPSKCHQLVDHSKMPCEHILNSQCPNGHAQSWKCHKLQPQTCSKCEKEAKRAQIEQQKAFERQQKRDAEQMAHAQKIAEIDSQIALEREKLRDSQLAQERANALRQKEKDLKAATSLASRASQLKSPLPNPNNVQAPPAANSSNQSASSSQTQYPASSPAPPKRGPTPASSSAVPEDSAPSKPPRKSPSEEEWQRQKDVDGVTNDAIDAIMGMIGLEDVKKKVLAIKARIDVTLQQGTSLKNERFNVVLLGNPGTGKTTVARHYAKFLTSLQVLPGDIFIETTGSRLANDGVPGIKKQIEQVINGGGGAIFVDEAYQLTSEHNFQGSQVLDFMLAEMENNIGVIAFILAGYNKEMEKFFEHNPGLTSRVPWQLQFEDYNDAEFLEMLVMQIEKKWSGRMKVEGGTRGLFCRIVVKRLGRRRGRDGFGNARELQNVFSKICERQAERLAVERRKGMDTDVFRMVKADLIGPDPSQAKVDSKAWNSLQSLIGLKAVKESIRQMFALIETNYERELREKEPMQMSLNRVFLGSPGTGKTSVAKLYGQILADLGLLSNGEVVIKNPSDFVGSVLGDSEKNTKAILANTVGKVLIIDEAYMLYNGNLADPYRTAVIDTLVAEIQSVPGEDRCVLLLGYKAEIVEMFQNVNPGLSRRFAIENAFHFEDFSDSELTDILNLKLKSQDLRATDAAKQVAIEVLSRLRNRPNFGNAGEVENLLSRAKTNFQTRQTTLPPEERSFEPNFEPRDFDPEFDRSAQATTNLEKLFEDIVGCDAIVEKLRRIQTLAHVAKKRGEDARDLVPTNFVFKGPPGTGKTTVARMMGQVFYDMGMLSSGEVVECSASDLVGQFVGQTGPKTKKLFEKALGKVLFVDEAYRLGEGHFAKEAIDEVVGLLTHETFKAKLVVILAGYDQEMNRLLDVNTGLSSRFQEDIVFPNMPPGNCLEVLDKALKKKGIRSIELSDPSSVEYKEMWRLIEELSKLPSWGNAREMVTLSKQMVGLVYQNLANGAAEDGELTLRGKDAVGCIRAMLENRRERSTNTPVATGRSTLFDNMFAPAPIRPTMNISTAHATKVETAKKEEVPRQEKQDEGRDPGVTDEIWQQLQADKRAAEMAKERAEEEKRELERIAEEEARRVESEAAECKKLAEAKTRMKDAAARTELERKIEEARIREIKARAEKARIEAILEEKRKAEMVERQREAQAQAKLREMGVCPVGYRWIRQANGYRCSAGSHFVSDAELR